MINADKFNGALVTISYLVILISCTNGKQSRFNSEPSPKRGLEVYNNLDSVYNNKDNAKEVELGFIKDGFPVKLLECLQLEKIKILHSQIDSIPSEIIKLKKLKSLEVSYSNLEYVPKEVGGLMNLENLDFAYNNLKTIPTSISNLINLRSLRLHGNTLNSLDLSICNLQNLKLLSLSYFYGDNHIDSSTYAKLKLCLPYTAIALRPIE